jgi:hypothetical protein
MTKDEGPGIEGPRHVKRRVLGHWYVFFYVSLTTDYILGYNKHPSVVNTRAQHADDATGDG